MNKLFVFDTNVFISASFLTGSISARALDRAFETGKVIVSDATFTEFTEVLFRKKFDKYLTDERRLQILEKLERDTISFQITTTVTACRDPKDNKFLELALTANATCIVSGDNDLLVLNPFRTVQILSPTEFLSINW